jgi:outer membrane receptor protein involved in Fe transport
MLGTVLLPMAAVTAATSAQPAQDQSAQADQGQGAIVVTATRRKQALADVPLAVSAVSAKRLRHSGAHDIRQLNQLVPSLFVSSTGTEAGAAVARIRGVGTVGDNPGLEASVPVFIDGVYRSRTGMALTELGPVDQIEVLRGPQGTLFGRNASAGLISVETAKPQFQTAGEGALTIGNYGLWRGDASVTGAVTSTLEARLDAVVVKRDGFLHDLVSGRDFNDRNRWMVRAQALYQPSSELSVRIIGDYTRRREQCCAAIYLPMHDTVLGPNGTVEYLPSTMAALERGMGAILDDSTHRDTSVTAGRDYTSNVDDYGLSAQADYDLGGARLTSITAWRHNDFVRGVDLDYNNLDLLYRTGNGGTDQRFNTFTQELRLQGKTFGDRLDWLVGGFFMDERLRLTDNLAYGQDFARYSNCLVALSFASGTGQPGLLDPSNSTCFNPTVANSVLPSLSAGSQAVVSAFARLGTFAGPGYTDSGFSNLAAASGFPGLSLNGAGMNDRWNQTDDNWALFTHDIFTIAPGLNLTLGARFTHDHKRVVGNLTDTNPLCSFYSANIPSLQGLPCSVVQSSPGGQFTGSAAKSENNLSGTAVLSYKFGQTLAYASYSRGYKAGGFNLDRSGLTRVGGSGAIVGGSTLAPLEFKPETDDALELGAKYHSRTFDLNVALFHELFRNFQLNTFNGLFFIVDNINSCKASLNGADTDNDPATGACTAGTRAGVKSQGVEVEGAVRPGPDVEWDFGATYADTRYRHDLVGSGGHSLTNTLFQLPGRRISNSNAWTLTSALAWTPRLGSSGLRGLVYADARYMSPYNTGSDLDIEKMQKAYTLVNARLGISGAGDRWSVELWAQNLFNVKFMQIAFDSPLQGSGTQRGVIAGFYPVSTQLYGAFIGEPRTFGVTLRRKF